MFLGWPEVVGIVASVAVIGLTVYKILSLRKTVSADDFKNLEEKLARHQLEDDKVHAEIAVLKTQMDTVQEDVGKVEEHCEKAQDLLIKLLTEDKIDIG